MDFTLLENTLSMTLWDNSPSASIFYFKAEIIKEAKPQNEVSLLLHHSRIKVRVLHNGYEEFHEPYGFRVFRRIRHKASSPRCFHEIF